MYIFKAYQQNSSIVYTFRASDEEEARKKAKIKLGDLNNWLISQKEEVN